MVRFRCFHVGAVFTLAILLGSGVAAAQAPRTANEADARELNLRAYAQLIRSDIRSQAAAVVSQVMQFSEAEDEKFWPVYREFEADLAKINDDRIKLIREYAGSYDNITDAIADRLALGALDLESRRHALKVKYYERFKSVLSPKTAARFLQVENQLLLLLDLQIAASLPIAQ